MSSIRRLAGQTAVYGIPSILGRILGYLLVPLYTHVFRPGAYGTVNVFYSYASFLMVILTYGMETAFFRFNEKESGKDKVYSTSLLSIIVSSSVFLAAIILFSDPIARAIDYPDKRNYVVWFGWILALDAVASIPFARLRALNRPIKFAAIKLTGIVTNVVLNLFLIVLCPYLLKHFPGTFDRLLSFFYKPGWGIEYIFISNLVASILTLILLAPELFSVKLKADPALLRRMLIYAFPLLFAGMAGIVNETFDRLLLRYLLPENISEYQVGIYAACYKISILMTIFIQAYRYAAEPFFFSHAKEKDAAAIYARIMDYFVIVISFIFLVTMIYLDDFILRFIDREYWSGKAVIPVLMLANLFLGVYYNLSIWYKLTNKTIWGAWLAIAGAIITLVLNLIWIPAPESKLIHGYYGSAWATFICYASMMVLSYLIGQKFFPVKYRVGKFFGYLGLSVLLWYTGTLVKTDSKILSILIHTLFVAAFCVVVLVKEKPSLKLFYDK